MWAMLMEAWNSFMIILLCFSVFIITIRLLPANNVCLPCNRRTSKVKQKGTEEVEKEGKTKSLIPFSDH